MIKPPRSDQPKVHLEITPQVSEAIDELVATGLYGRSRATVARQLLYGAVRLQLEYLRQLRRRR